VLKEYRPQVIRTFVLNSHYSSPVDYSEAALHSAGSGWERLTSAVRLNRQMMGDAPESDESNRFLERVEKNEERLQRSYG